MLASEALGIDLIEDTLYLLLVLLGVKLWHEFPAKFGESKIPFRFLFTALSYRRSTVQYSLLLYKLVYCIGKCRAHNIQQGSLK